MNQVTSFPTGPYRIDPDQSLDILGLIADVVDRMDTSEAHATLRHFYDQVLFLIRVMEYIPDDSLFWEHEYPTPLPWKQDHHDDILAERVVALLRYIHTEVYWFVESDTWRNIRMTKIRNMVMTFVGIWIDDQYHTDTH